MFPARAWELLAGCLVALKKDYLVKFLPNFKIITILSLTVILTSFFVLDKSKSTTNMVFLLPVLSTCIFLISSGESKLHFLNNSTLTYLGKISYSLYLWHWPLISIYNYLLYPEVSTFLDKVYILILTLLLASLTYHFIETPFRKRNFCRKQYLAAFTIPSIICLLITYSKIEPLPEYIFKDGGYATDFTSNINDLPHTLNYNKMNPLSLDIIVIGSSHARMYYDVVNTIAEEHKLNVTHFSVNAHTAIKSKSSSNTQFSKNFYNKRSDFLENNKARIILVGERYIGTYGTMKTDFKSEYLNFFKSLLKNSDKVITLESPPQHIYKDILFHTNRMNSINQDFKIEELPESQLIRSEINKDFADIKKQLKEKFSFIITSDLLLKNDRINFSNSENYLLYKDEHHLSKKGVFLFKERLEKAILRNKEL